MHNDATCLPNNTSHEGPYKVYSDLHARLAGDYGKAKGGPTDRPPAQLIVVCTLLRENPIRSGTKDHQLVHSWRP
jgi:hypothetical protein